MRFKIKIQILEIFTLFLQIKSEGQIPLQSFTWMKSNIKNDILKWIPQFQSTEGLLNF